MIKIAALSSGPNTPSANFRIRQHIPALKKMGVTVADFYPSKDKNTPPPHIPNWLPYRIAFPYVAFWMIYKSLWRIPHIVKQKNYDLLWLNREFVPGILSTEVFLYKPYIFDFDDAIWTAKPFGRFAFAYLCKRAKYVVAGNEYLASQARKYSDKVAIIPTSVDTNKIFPEKAPFSEGVIRLGWIGTKGNYQYLYDIELELHRCLAENKDIRIHLCADEKPNFKLLKENTHWLFKKWTPNCEQEFLNTIDIGLMPLRDTIWEQGKCSFKMLQYMAAGRPSIVSPVGMNKSLLEHGDIALSSQTGQWSEKILSYVKNQELARLHGQNSRKIVAKLYSNSAIAKQLYKILSN